MFDHSLKAPKGKFKVFEFEPLFNDINHLCIFNTKEEACDYATKKIKDKTILCVYDDTGTLVFESGEL